jgi:membrane peptidoglycan carboxypeptidase
MNLMLRGVVNEGTGKKAAVAGYSVAGKTGTSRKPGPGGGYTDASGVTQYIGTFVGFVPAENPQFSIIVVVDEPSRESIYGGDLSAPVFSQVATTALREFAVPPPATDLARQHATSVSTAEAPEPTGTATTAGGRVKATAAGVDNTGEPGAAGVSGNTSGVAPAAPTTSSTTPSVPTRKPTGTTPTTTTAATLPSKNH